MRVTFGRERPDAARNSATASETAMTRSAYRQSVPAGNGSRRRSRECHAQGIPAFCAIAPVKSCAVALFAWTIFGATSRMIRRSWLAPTTHESA